MNPKRNISLPLLAALLMVILQGCDEPDAKPVSSAFFPLTKGQELTYQRWIGNAEITNIFDTLCLTVGGHVTVDGLIYTEVNSKDGSVSKLIRQEGSKFFGRQHELYGVDFTHEYLFLDTEKNVGDSWSFVKNDAYSKTEYVVTGKNTTHRVNGVLYTNIMEIQVNYYLEQTPGEETLWLSAQHWYAPGVGEIYSFYPYPVSLYYGDISSFILPVK